MMQKPRVSVHKFSSCDGCQLALLNAGDALFQLTELVEFVHFAEAGFIDPEARNIDIAFIEGSVSTPDELTRIQAIRAHATYLITIGACATAGGVQALRNAANHAAWLRSIYPSPAFVASLKTSSAIAKHVKVDLEIWGCPVNTQQVIDVIRSLLYGTNPKISRDAVCHECKRQGHVCVVVTKKEPCMGPVTRTGCGALCPSVGRGCYACYGPSENPNTMALGQHFQTQGVKAARIAQQFLHINSQAPAFQRAGLSFKGIPIVKK